MKLLGDTLVLEPSSSHRDQRAHGLDGDDGRRAGLGCNHGGAHAAGDELTARPTRCRHDVSAVEKATMDRTVEQFLRNVIAGDPVGERGPHRQGRRAESSNSAERERQVIGPDG
jgi:hypothetical protein